MSPYQSLLAFFRTQTLTFVSGWRSTVPANKYCLPHTHAALEIVYHLRGGGVTTLNGHERHAFDEGSAVIYPPHLPHDQKMTTQAGEDLCILVELPEAAPSALRICQYIPRVMDPMVLHDLRTLVDLPPALAPMQRLSLNYRVTAVMAHLLQFSAPFAPQAGDVVERYAELAYNYVQRDYQHIEHLEEIAQRIGISYDYLRHLFKQRYGMSLIQWLTRVRTERAKDLLTYSTLPIKEIALVCGFDNDRYFSKVFKNAVGCPPGAYRRASAAHE
jgi:AraC-like DNA-binding protein